MTIPLTDAQEQHRRYPDTFEVPSDEALARIQPDWFVMACFFDKERMWVRVTHVGEDLITGVLDNEPVLVPMELGQVVFLEKRHVYGVMPPKGWEEE